MMRVEDTAKNREQCICGKCPSYPQGCEGELLFCARGKSGCEIEARGCICNICPVYAEAELKEIYYCDKEEVGESRTWMRKKRVDEEERFYQTVVDIKEMAATGESVVRSMGSLRKLPYSLDDLHFVPAQLSRIPLNREDEVAMEVVIGPRARKPLKVWSPIMISGLSYGAVSRNVRLVISQLAAKLKIGFNSGEGGVLKEELEDASAYLIVQYSTGRFGVTEEILKRAAAVEIRFGQGAYPGKGSYLPADKMTPEVAEVRGLEEGEAAYSPAHHPDMTTTEAIQEKVKWLRELTSGVPVGAKIGCGDVEADVEVLVNAGVDFIALDGFGGGTGATDGYVRDNVGVPIVAALPRAYRVLKALEVKNKVSLIAGGGLRNGADGAKCLALGADAVYMGTAALIAMGCEQYRICHTGLCPTGITTHNPALEQQLKMEQGVERLSNFITAATGEIANLTRIVGKDDVNQLKGNDLVSMSKELAEITGVRWLGGG